MKFARGELLTFLFYENFPQEKYIERLKSIRTTLQRSEFFRTHEVIGSSLLFVHDRNKASIWLIDFAKTISLPTNTEISHKNEWRVGNHEDGYLIGINNLIAIFEDLINDHSKRSIQICDNHSDSEATNQQPLPTDDDDDESAGTGDVPSPEIKKLTINQSSENDCDQ